MRWMLVLLFLGIPLIGFSGDLNVKFNFEGDNLHEVGGGTDLILHESDTLTIENTVMLDADHIDHDYTLEVAGDDGAVSQKLALGYTGGSAFYSKYLKIYAVPLGYNVTNRLKLLGSIPYVDRTFHVSGKDYRNSGLGDISLGVSYVLYLSDRFVTSSTLNSALPTGDVKATSGDYNVPLGTGTYSFSFSQSFLLKIIKSVDLYANIGLRYFGDSKYDVANVTYQLDRGMSYFGLLGGTYRINDRWGIDGKVNYIRVEEGSEKIGDNDWTDRNDFIQASDAVLGVKYRVGALTKYRLLNNYAVKLISSIPIYTDYDKNVDNAENREWSVNLSITKFF